MILHIIFAIKAFLKTCFQLTAKLVSKKYAEEIRKKINDNKTYNVSYYEPMFDQPEDHGTSQISVLAADGSAVSVTTTIDLQ